MTRPTVRHAAMAVALLVASSAAFAVDEKDPIGDFLADISAGSVSAAEILGLPASAVTTIHAPKDVVAFIGGLTSDKAKQGMGVSFTPARTRLAPVSISDYSTSTAARIWAGTTFSYAQNRQTYGNVEYRQDALALHGSFYVNKNDDPAVAVHAAFARCVPVSEAMKNAAVEIAKLREQVIKETVAAQLVLGKSEVEAKAFANEMAETLMQARADQLRREMRETAIAAATRCVDTAAAAAAEKWNASQVAYTLGAGWVKGPGAAQRLSLGRTLNVSAALWAGPSSLVNLTLKRTQRAVDTETLAATPAYRASTLAAARWTYGHGDKAGLFLLAEVSNAKASRETADNNVFKAALGLDKRIWDGGWLEFRIGRKRSADSGKEETVGLLNLKLAPGASIPKLRG